MCLFLVYFEIDFNTNLSVDIEGSLYMSFDAFNFSIEDSIIG